MVLDENTKQELINKIKEVYKIDINLANFESEVEKEIFRAELGKKDWQGEKVRLFKELIKKIKLDNKDYNFEKYFFPSISFDGENGEGQIFEGDVNFRGAEFGGDVDFRGANFGGSVDFVLAKFGGDVDFLLAEFGGSVDFIEAEFQRNVNFRLAEFKGNVDFTLTKFENDIDFSLAKFEGSVKFFSTKSERNLDFYGTKFENDIDFRLGKFKGGLNFESAKLKGNLDFNKISIVGLLNFEFSHFGEIFFKGISDKLKKFRFLDSNLSGINFIDLKIPEGRIVLGDEIYLREKEGKEISIQDYEALQKLYCDFKNIYEKKGQRSIADRFYTREMDIRLEKLKKLGVKGGPERILLFIYLIISDYGQNFLFTIFWILFWIFLGAGGIYYSQNTSYIQPNFQSEYYQYKELSISNPEYKVKKKVDYPDSLLLAVRAFAFQKEENFNELNYMTKWILTGLFMLSPILLSVLVLAIKRRFKR